MNKRLPFAVLAASSALGCGAVEPKPSENGSLQILTGSAYTDTIVALPASPLRVRVVLPATSTGPARLSGIRITFSADEPGGSFYPPAVFRLGAEPIIALPSDTTDETGQLAVQVRLGTKAGVSYLRVEAPALGLKDSVRLTVLPGAPRILSGAPADTILMPGESFRLRALAVYDQANNVRPELPQLSVDDPCLTLTGDLVRAETPCRATIFLKAGAADGWLEVSVPPNLTVSTAHGAEVRIHRPNGTVLLVRPLSPPSNYFPFSTDWSPDGQFFVMGGMGNPLRLLGPSGAMTTLTDPDFYALYPKFSSDGLWIYYGRQNGPLTWELRRVRRDGSRDSLLAPAGLKPPAPSPSPDGSRVAYRAAGNILTILDLSTGSSTPLMQITSPAAWSPVADEIAVADAATRRLVVVRQDGSLVRSLLNLDEMEPPLKWSFDGRWLMAPLGTLGISMLDAQTGRGIPLNAPSFLTAPTWVP